MASPPQVIVSHYAEDLQDGTTSAGGTAAAPETLCRVHVPTELGYRRIWLYYAGVAYNHMAAGKTAWLKFSLAGQPVLILPAWRSPKYGTILGMAANTYALCNSTAPAPAPGVTAPQPAHPMTLFYNPGGYSSNANFHPITPFAVPVQCDMVELQTDQASHQFWGLVACLSSAFPV